MNAQFASASLPLSPVGAVHRTMFDFRCVKIDVVSVACVCLSWLLAASVCVHNSPFFFSHSLVVSVCRFHSFQSIIFCPQLIICLRPFTSLVLSTTTTLRCYLGVAIMSLMLLLLLPFVAGSLVDWCLFVRIFWGRTTHANTRTHWNPKR